MGNTESNSSPIRVQLDCQTMPSDDSGDIETIVNPLSPFPNFVELHHTELVDSILPKEIKDSLESTDRKQRKLHQYEYDERCPICDDRVSGYHYGILTCESCKGFFKRTVQNKKMYQCVDKRDCIINKLQRKRCPACRYAKCLAVGMKLEAVREDRLRGGRNKFGPLYKHDRALKQQKKAMIRNASIMQNIPTVTIPDDDATSNDVPPMQTDPKVKTEKYPFEPFNNPMLEQPADLYGGSNRYPRSIRARSSYSDYFHPYFGPHHDEGRFFYGYPYHDPRYFHSMMHPFRPPFMPSRHFMRYPDDDREAFYKSMNDSYFSHHPSERFRNMHHGPHSSSHTHFDYTQSPINPISYTPNTPQPSAPYNRSHAQPVNLFTPTSTSSNSDDIQFEHREPTQPNQPKLQTKNPFECTNMELIKKMIHSWVPEEDLRKQSQLASKDVLDLNPLQIIVKIVEQILYSMVDWAKSSIFFRDMTTEDQMSLLHETWSELVLLDHIYRQVWFSDSHSILLVNGKSLALSEIQGMFDVNGTKLIERVSELSNRFRQIQIDRTELVCLKFLILFNAKDSKVQNQHFMTRVSERINSCLLEYVHANYPDQADRFLQLLMRLPDVRGLSLQVENWLNDQYLNGMIPNNTLMAEMLNIRFQKTM